MQVGVAKQYGVRPGNWKLVDINNKIVILLKWRDRIGLWARIVSTM